ncbi:MAG: hypothetical protein IID05_11585 [Gemmatimonadetes bacterium]|nr:hypothetical protein [Gemmatimonadota bacterium]
MPSCKEVARLIASEELVDAGRFKRALVRIHVLMCRHCRRYAAELRAIGAAAHDRWASGAPDGALERLERSILERCLDASDVNTEHRRGGDPEPPATRTDLH